MIERADLLEERGDRGEVLAIDRECTKAFDRLDEVGGKLRSGVQACLERAGVPGAVTGMGSLFRLHPAERAFVDYRSGVASEAERVRLDRLYRELIDHGILLAPTGLGCLSTAVGEAEIEYFLEVLNACIHNGDSA